MPVLPNNLLDSVVYLYSSVENAQDNVPYGGTGFLISVPSNRQGFPSHQYLVTNAHVIEEGGNCVRINTLNGSTDVVLIENKDWHIHPQKDDIAVAPICLKDNYKFKLIEEELLLTEQDIREVPIQAGLDVFMLGRFLKHQGKKINVPTMRFGNIAMMNNEPIEQKRRYLNSAGSFAYRLQESFLVEMRSIGGFSGSPVFVYTTGFVPLSGGGSRTQGGMGWRTPIRLLLGIDWGHLEESNMACVVPAWKLKELLYTDNLVKMRQEVDTHFEDEKSK